MSSVSEFDCGIDPEGLSMKGGAGGSPGGKIDLCRVDYFFLRVRLGLRLRLGLGLRNKGVGGGLGH